MEDMSKICDRFQQFCANSAKPLLYGGAFLTLTSAVAIGYLACTANAFFRKLDETIATSTFTLDYYTQLGASIYLLLITVAVCVTAYYEQKHAIRVLAILTTINVLLVPAAYLLMQTNQSDLPALFHDKLVPLEKDYDFKEKPTLADQTSDGHNDKTATPQDSETSPMGQLPKVLETTQTNKTKRDIDEPKREATRKWDLLQSRGCCGFNSTDEWNALGVGIPKSCCESPEHIDSKYTCKKADDDHKRPCREVIELEQYKSIGVLAFIGLVNVYLAVISLIGAYRTLHYDEASQNAYN